MQKRVWGGEGCYKGLGLGLGDTPVAQQGCPLMPAILSSKMRFDGEDELIAAWPYKKISRDVGLGIWFRLLSGETA